MGDMAAVVEAAVVGAGAGAGEEAKSKAGGMGESLQGRRRGRGVQKPCSHATHETKKNTDENKDDATKSNNRPDN